MLAALMWGVALAAMPTDTGAATGTTGTTGTGPTGADTGVEDTGGSLGSGTYATGGSGIPSGDGAAAVAGEVGGSACGGGQAAGWGALAVVPLVLRRRGQGR